MNKKARSAGEAFLNIHVYTCPGQLLRGGWIIYPVPADRCRKDKVNTGCQKASRALQAFFPVTPL